MKYKINIDCEHPWEEGYNRELCVNEIVAALRLAADRLEEMRKDDIMTKRENGFYMLQGWWN